MKALSKEQREEMDYRLEILRDSILDIESDLSEMYGHKHELFQLADKACKEVSHLRYRYQDFLDLENSYLMPGDEKPKQTKSQLRTRRFWAIWLERKDEEREE